MALNEQLRVNDNFSGDDSNEAMRPYTRMSNDQYVWLYHTRATPFAIGRETTGELRSLSWFCPSAHEFRGRLGSSMTA